MRARWAAWGLGCAALASAADPASPAPATPAPASTEEVLSAARRDLETIRALRSPGAGAGKADLPQLAAPELNPLPAPVMTERRPAPGSTKPGAPGSAGAKENWLVDAMMRKGDRPANPPLAGELVLSGEERETADSPAAATKARREGERDPTRGDAKAGAPQPANPLSTFMAGWMTSQDYQLYLAGTSAGVPGSIATERASAAARDGLGATLSGERSSAPSTAGAAPGQAARENPFLAALGPTGPAANPPAATPVGAVTPSAPPPKAPAIAPPPAPASPPASPIPSFVKPADDAKYFKPLKRF